MAQRRAVKKSKVEATIVPVYVGLDYHDATIHVCVCVCIGRSGR